MMKKAWELIALLIVIVVVGNLIAISVQPFLPILGIVVVLIVSGLLVRFFFFRNRV